MCMQWNIGDQNELNIKIGNYMNGTRRYYAKRNKSEKDKYMT